MPLRLFYRLPSAASRLLSSASKPVVAVKWLGSELSYQDGLRAQAMHLQALAQHVDKGSEAAASSSSAPHTLLLLEHRPVYTVGIRSEDYSPEEAERLRSLGADFVASDRGGLITFHGAGQLVAYPLLDLGELRGAGAVRWYVGQLEQWIRAFVGEHYGIPAGPMEGCTGVWVRGDGKGRLDRKIAAIGIHVTRRRLTSHGIALNASTDLRWFEHIVPCGIVGKGVTSVTEETGRTVEPKEILRTFAQSFAHAFGAELEYAEDFPV